MRILHALSGRNQVSCLEPQQHGVAALSGRGGAAMGFACLFGRSPKVSMMGASVGFASENPTLKFNQKSPFSVGFKFIILPINTFFKISHTIHAWYIYLHFPLQNRPTVGKSW